MFHSITALPAGSSLQAPSSPSTCLSLTCFCRPVKWQQLPNEFPFITSSLSQDQLAVELVLCVMCLCVGLSPFCCHRCWLSWQKAGHFTSAAQINLVGVCVCMHECSYFDICQSVSVCTCAVMSKERFLFNTETGQRDLCVRACVCVCVCSANNKN